MKRVTACGYPRLHWSLVDMSGASKRMYGGFGVAVNAYATIASAEPDKGLYIETSGSIEARTRVRISSFINLISNCIFDYIAIKTNMGVFGIGLATALAKYLQVFFCFCIF